MKPLPPSFDVITIGSGAAGLYAALCLPSHLRVAIASKDRIEVGASRWAQGGMAAAIAPTDSPQLHFEDTLKAGAGLCDRDAVKFLVENARQAVEGLLELGVAFDRQGSDLALTLEAAHSHPRVLHAADTTGRAIVDVLARQVLERPNIHTIERAFVLDLWRDEGIGAGDRCRGVCLLHDGKVQWLEAGAVILATGGCGRIFESTTNPSVSTGDGAAMAWRAGARLRDVEFFQFHPTALSLPNAPRFLISEAVRGEGGHLVDATGDRFAFRYHEAGELAPRDVVSRAIFQHVRETQPQPACVYLDLRPIDRDRARYRFPNILKVCRTWGIDPLTDRVPVSPAAHYWMGGVRVDATGRTSIADLYAVGETASTGVHGANRLASNSLLECLTFARQLSALAVRSPSSRPPETVALTPPDAARWSEEKAAIADLQQKLRSLMWDSAGIFRRGEVLQAALERVENWRHQTAELSVGKFLLQLAPARTATLPDEQAAAALQMAAETRNLLDAARSILRSAIFRTESRGGHYRADYPDRDDRWRAHTEIEGDRIETTPVATP